LTKFTISAGIRLSHKNVGGGVMQQHVVVAQESSVFTCYEASKAMQNLHNGQFRRERERDNLLAK